MAKQSAARIYTFLSNLQSDFHSSNIPSEAIRFAVERQLERAKKKARLSGKGLRKKAHLDFVEVNRLVGEVQITLSHDIIRNASEYIRNALERYCKACDHESLQQTFTWSQIYQHWAYGPGASNDVPGKFGCVEKIDEPMTYTKSAEPYVKRLRLEDTYFRSFDAANGNDGCLLTYGSRLDTVPKNETTLRMIAIEPSGNMALQLAAGSVIEGALRRLGLDIRTQQKVNRGMAHRGSLHGSLATIDLKSASDMFSPGLIRLLWPAEWYNLFMRLRSPSTKLLDGSIAELNMISTMGNGFTFPMMTLTLLALCYANRYVNHGGRHLYVSWYNTGVFGDDIIVPTSEFCTLVSTLSAAGLVVNHDKSYSDGPFRESCGGDYYKGYNVTPFYVKSLDRAPEIYVVLNQVLQYCAVHNLYAPRTLKYLFSLLRKVYFVPEWMQDTSGIRTSQCAREYSHLMSVPVLKPYNGSFSMRLACGNYVLSDGDGVQYTPRRNGEDLVVYRTGSARLPNGYLDGWDPRYRTQRESAHVSLLVSMAQ